MADKTLGVRLKPCAHTATEWASDTYKNKVLLDGEIGYEKNTGRYKIGDGENVWADLAWGQATPYSHNHSASNITSGTLSVARGGTGKSSLDTGKVLVGNGTSAVSLRAIDTTNGGTSGSDSLITSGAVYLGLETLKEDTAEKYISGLSVSGKTITYTKGDGTTGTITTQDTNNSVTQTNTTTNASYRVLFSATADNTTRTEGARKASNLLFNPSTGALTATSFVGKLTGNADTATSAEKWTTARNISISDADASNTGTAVSVDGSEAETLKLPATIKATLKGNADTATTATTANKVANSLKINNKTYNGSAAIDVGTIGVAYGGTGKTTAKDAANMFINALDTGSSTPEDADYYISQYVNGGTTTTTYHRRPMSALWSYIQNKISSVLGLTASSYGGNAVSATKATQDGNGNTIASTYLKLTGGTLTLSAFYGLTLKRKDANGVAISYQNSSGALGGIGFLSGGDFVVSSGTTTAGNILKASTTAATFPGTVTAPTFIGNLTGNADTASKVKNNLVIKINGGTTEGTNLFTYNGSAAKTVNITPDGINALERIIGYYGSDTADTAGWYKVCTVSQTGYSDYSLNLLFTRGYSTIATGILHVHTRCSNSTTIDITAVKWLYRLGFNAGDVIVTKDTNTWSLYVKQSVARYGRIQVQVLSKMGTSGDTSFSLSNNLTVESAAPSGTTAEDGATVNLANVAAKWQTACTLTIGLKGKSVDGGGNVSWSLAEIGAVAKAGDTMTGALTVNSNITASMSNATYTSVKASNSNGSVGIYAATNWGLYDFTNSGWIVYYNASSKKNILNGDATGNAATATQAYTTFNNTGATYYPVFVTGTSGNKSLTADTAISYATKNGVAATDSAAATEGYAYLILGNSTSSTAANGQTGRIRLYTPGTAYVNITSASNSTSRDLVIPALAGTRYIAVTTTTSAVGGTTNPVYVAANGVLTALSASAGGTTQPVYLNSGTLTGISAVAVAYGGTGATTLTSGYALIGNGTNAVAFRAITNMTSKSYITYNTNLMTTNTLAYWNGAYNSSNSSNLTYCNKGAFGTIITKAADDYVLATGGTFTGTVVFSKTQDLSGTANNSPAVIIGGAATAAHLEIDANEIQAKNNGTTTASLYLNNDGGLVTIGNSGLTVKGTSKFIGGLTAGDSTQSTCPTTGIAVHDVRNATIYPQSFGDKNANFYFDMIDSTWFGIMHVTGWTGSTYAAWELAGNAHNSSYDNLLYRQGIGTTWQDWQTILTSSNYTTYVIPKTGGTFTGNIAAPNITSTGGINGASIELSHATPYIDFHYNKSTADYTSRIIERASGILSFTGAVKIEGSQITTTLIMPSANNTYNIGSASTTYHYIFAKNHYIHLNGVQYGIFYASTAGTTDTVGTAYLMVGNATASGAANNARGYVRLYGTNTGYTQLATGNNTTSNIALTLPSVAGKIPVVSLSGTTLTIST